MLQITHLVVRETLYPILRKVLVISSEESMSPVNYPSSTPTELAIESLRVVIHNAERCNRP
jgi:hypothetical protein